MSHTGEKHVKANTVTLLGQYMSVIFDEPGASAVTGDTVGLIWNQVSDGTKRGFSIKHDRAGNKLVHGVTSGTTPDSAVTPMIEIRSGDVKIPTPVRLTKGFYAGDMGADGWIMVVDDGSALASRKTEIRDVLYVGDRGADGWVMSVDKPTANPACVNIQRLEVSQYAEVAKFANIGEIAAGSWVMSVDDPSVGTPKITVKNLVSSGYVKIPAITSATHTTVSVDTATGQLYANASTARLKRDITEAKIDPRQILQFGLRAFKLGESNNFEIGYIAEDVYKFAPSCCISDNRGLASLNSNAMIAYLIELNKRTYNALIDIAERVGVKSEILRAFGEPFIGYRLGADVDSEYDQYRDEDYVPSVSVDPVLEEDEYAPGPYVITAEEMATYLAFKNAREGGLV